MVWIRNIPLFIKIITIWIYKYSQSIFQCSVILLGSWADTMLHNVHLLIRTPSATSSQWRCKIGTDLNFNDCCLRKKVSSRWTECASNRDTFSELNGLSIRYLHGIFSSFLFPFFFSFVAERERERLSHEEWRRYYSQET